MDRNRLLERRYSFNASIKNPAAESTTLNLTNANRSGLGSSFKWGSSPISPKQRSNSSTNFINHDSTVSGNGLDRSRCRSMRKIDPRVVADVQSKGLASRIVKYHENGNRLNRSMSAHNLYSKPGQFPVVTLRKTDLPYRATKQNVSMTRIAPPEKSVFYGSTLSSLLRSNSIVGLHKSDEDISRENRPILHPPPTENDMAPTRSVLDVLKEISRKRINSDDPDVMETSKKNRFGSDLVDTGAQTMMTQSFKRQRDLNSPHNGDAISSSKYQDTRFSPEQAKKRVCNYNNDITSSLSSSAKRNTNVNKRPSYQLNQTMPPNLESYETQKNKTPKCDDRITNTDVRFNNLENTTAKVVNSNVGTSTVSDGYVYGAVPPRSKSEPIPVESGRTTVPNNKPRLTLFNKAIDVNNGRCENTEVDDNTEVPGECAGIQFVKPKKLSSAGLKNPVIERAQKSKLALMLSGLRGELYHESDNDELDAPQPKQDKKSDNESKAIQDKKKSEGEVGVATTSAASSSNTSTFTSNISPIAVTAASKLPEKADTTNSKTQFTIKTASSNSSPLVGLKLSPPTTKTNVGTTTQKAEISTPTLQGFPSSSAASLVQPVPGFNTTAAGTLGTTVSLSTMTQSTFAAKPLAASKTTPSADLAKTLTNAASVANIDFGNVAKTTTTTSTAALPANTFAFSTANGIMTNKPVLTTCTNAPSVVHPPSVITPAPSVAVASSMTASTMFSNSFSFGANIATTSAPSQTFALKPVVATSASAGPFSFGSPSDLQTNLGTPTVKSSGTFSSLSNATTAAAPNTQFSFGSAVTPNTNTPSAGNALSFGSSNTDKSSMFNVGTPKAAPTLISVAEATRPTFVLPAPSAAPTFGSASTTTASNMFGSTNPQAQSMFGPTAPKAAFGSEGSKPSSSVFGGSSADNSVFPTVNFGQPSADKPVLVNKPTAAVGGFSFGAASAGAPGGGSFTFGGTNSTTNANSSQAPTGQSTFSFSAGASVPEKISSNNLFGGSASARPAEASSGGFSFGSGAGTAAVQKPASTFAFGAPSSSSGGGNSSLSSTAGGFSFGAVMQQKTNDTALAKSFNFGSSVSNNNQALATTNNNPVATNMFASNMMNKPASPGFNFGAATGSTPQATVAPAAANNIFAPSVTMAAAPGSGDRPIRRATRRLQK